MYVIFYINPINLFTNKTKQIRFGHEIYSLIIFLVTKPVSS
jgi:hypothetical protein